MKYLYVASLLALPVFFGGCSTNGVMPAGDETATLSSTAQRETILLVSLDDGSVIKQTISSNADFCFKSSAQSYTTCLTQGEPVIDPVSNAVIGFEMIEDHIELIAKSD